jgi:ribosomal protein L24
MKGTKRAKLRKNDQVVVIAGPRQRQTRSRAGGRADKGKIKVEGVGMIKRHQKAAGNRGRGALSIRIVAQHFKCHGCRSAIRQAVAPCAIKSTATRRRVGSREWNTIETK